MIVKCNKIIPEDYTDKLFLKSDYFKLIIKDLHNKNIRDNILEAILEGYYIKWKLLFEEYENIKV